jgi:septum site-determining protein MinD
VPTASASLSLNADSWLVRGLAGLQLAGGRSFFQSIGGTQLAKIVVVTSGKGGVGKTTTSAAFASGLALRGYKTVVIDFDVGLRNLDLVMGCERRVVFDLLNVIHGEGSLNQALIRDKRVENLCILPASQTRDKDALTLDGVGEVMAALRESFEYIICDSPAGIERGAVTSMYFADEALVVTNPEVSSVRDSDRIIGMLASKTKRAEEDLPPVKEHLVVTRYDPRRVDRGDMLGADDIREILAIPFLGVIPESKSVLAASNSGVPVTLTKDSDAGQAYLDIVDRFLGKELPHRFMDPPKRGLLARILGT